MKIIKKFKKHIQIKNLKVNMIIFILLLNSCNNFEKKSSSPIDEKIKNLDSIVVYRDKNGRLECIYNILNNKDKFIKEGICFLSNGDIDFDKSTFLEIKGNDLHYFSPFKKSYKIGIDRYVVFKGNDSIKKDFSNIELLKLSEYKFNNDGVIKNFKNKIPKIGIVEEIIYLDSVVKYEGKNKRIIETYESFIDIENLLIKKVKKIR